MSAKRMSKSALDDTTKKTFGMEKMEHGRPIFNQKEREGGMLFFPPPTNRGGIG